jgi:hypothetical protein
MSANKVNNVARELLIYVAALFILLLASSNIESYLSPKKVLGTETSENSNEVFWQDFLTKNPNYLPGWLELGRVDKVKEIDPNYIRP